MRSLVVLGDDLSGTTEALAAALAGQGSGRVFLRPPRSGEFADEPATGWDAVDLDARRLPHDTALARYDEALRTLRRDAADVTLLKIDSLLRGNVAAALAATAPAADRPVVVAPALPAQGRRTVQGRVRLAQDGRPRPGVLEGARTDVLAAVDRPASLLGLDVVRQGPRHLSTVLRGLADDGLVAVCDAETEEDLDTVAAAAARYRHPVVVGAGGVAAALGRVLRADSGDNSEESRRPEPCTDRDEPGGRVLVVVGTAEPASRAQVARLESAGAAVQTLEPAAAAAAETADTLRTALDAGCAVLQMPSQRLEPDRAGHLLNSLATTVATVVDGSPGTGLVLTGGATARAVLTGTGVETLCLRCEVHPGAAHLVTAAGRDVVTRPGSHGGADSLVQLARHLGARVTPSATDTAPAPHAAPAPDRAQMAASHRRKD